MASACGQPCPRCVPRRAKPKTACLDEALAQPARLTGRRRRGRLSRQLGRQRRREQRPPSRSPVSLVTLSSAHPARARAARVVNEASSSRSLSRCRPRAAAHRAGEAGVAVALRPPALSTASRSLPRQERNGPRGSLAREIDQHEEQLALQPAQVLAGNAVTQRSSPDNLGSPARAGPGAAVEVVVLGREREKCAAWQWHRNSSSRSGCIPARGPKASPSRNGARAPASGAGSIIACTLPDRFLHFAG